MIKHYGDNELYIDLLHAYIDSANDAIFVLCDEMKFLMSNNLSIEWFGATSSELTKHNCRIPVTHFICEHDYIQVFEKNFQEVLSGGSVQFECYINPPKCQPRWIEINMNQVLLEIGTMVIGVARDITQRKHSEEELKFHREHLELLVEERTAELNESLEQLTKTQNRLIESEKMAALSGLVTGVAHELNTPLGICVTAASFLQDEMHKLNESIISCKETELLQKSDFIDSLENISKSTSILATNVNRTSRLIGNFKQVAVNISNEIMHSFNLLEFLEQFIQYLPSELIQMRHKIEIECDPALEIRNFHEYFPQSSPVF